MREYFIAKWINKKVKTKWKNKILGSMLERFAKISAYL